MPTHKSTEKRMRQNRKRYQRNMTYRTRLKNTVKLFKSIQDPEEAREKYPELVSVIDKSLKKGILNERKAARMKSRLSRNLSSS